MTKGIYLHKDAGVGIDGGVYEDHIVIVSGRKITLRMGHWIELFVGRFYLNVSDPQHHFEVLTGFTVEAFNAAYLGLAMRTREGSHAKIFC